MLLDTEVPEFDPDSYYESEDWDDDDDVVSIRGGGGTIEIGSPGSSDESDGYDDYDSDDDGLLDDDCYV